MEPIVMIERPIRVDDELVGEVMSLASTVAGDDECFTFEEMKKIVHFYLPEGRRERDMIFIRENEKLCGACGLILKLDYTFQEVELKNFFCVAGDYEGSVADMFLGHVIKAAKGKFKSKLPLPGIITYIPREDWQSRPYLFTQIHGFAIKGIRANKSNTLEFVSRFEKVVAP